VEEKRGRGENCVGAVKKMNGGTVQASRETLSLRGREPRLQ